MTQTLNGSVYAAILALAALIGPTSAQGEDKLPEPLQAKVNAAARACADFVNGSFTLEAGSVVQRLWLHALRHRGGLGGTWHSAAARWED